ncbi:GntR family transcriptional regulator [Chakrabartyella piscis]|uniref:GntR family transcriptional regulator n=1 Tax=Chakrabartyella piscis TaxID=2918914 RepID=UPI0029586D6D|nr:GntR family transcriptional regulator [Chakrabartyella piscis]
MLQFKDMQLDTNSPVYTQIVNFVKRQIFLGNAESGEAFPSRRELAATLRINPNTVQKAFRALEMEGLISTYKNTVSNLFYDEEMLQEIQQELTRDLVQDFVNRAKENKLTLDDIEKLLQELW